MFVDLCYSETFRLGSPIESAHLAKELVSNIRHLEWKRTISKRLIQKIHLDFEEISAEIAHYEKSVSFLIGLLFLIRVFFSEVINQETSYYFQVG